MSRRRLLVPALLASLFVVAASSATISSAHGDSGEPCDQCKPKRGEWSWKANGYALGASSDEAAKRAEKQATDNACRVSGTYLDAQKLKCKGKCIAGEVENACEHSKKPGCQNGTYADNKGMWTFVCRKYHEGSEPKVACDAEEAKRHPSYTMCDVSVLAVRTLACSHPDCGKSSE